MDGNWELLFLCCNGVGEDLLWICEGKRQYLVIAGEPRMPCGKSGDKHGLSTRSKVFSFQIAYAFYYAYIIRCVL